MNDFIFYFREGWLHIMSTDATDHLLFIVALAIIHTFQDLKKVLILVTSFTIGHAVTLYLSAFEIVRFPVEVVEFAIPCTIVLTALINLLPVGAGDRQIKQIQYPFAMAFGLIHGMGYANYIRMMLSKDQHFAMGLFSFNVGLEIGQIFVVLSILVISWLMDWNKHFSQRKLVILVSLVIMFVSFKIALERFQYLP